jgi:conjugative transfer signal peptidase TraF
MHKRAIMITAALGVAAVATGAIARPIPRIVWNATASAPIGLYRVERATEVRRDDLVLAWLPKGARRLVADRHYLPADVLLVKRVAATGGDTVCREHLRITINGIAVAAALATDSRGRALPRWSGCRTLGSNEVFLLMPDVSASFDGRYFGPIRTRAVIGRLVPLWTR